jgi:hypothetical protein
MFCSVLIATVLLLTAMRLLGEQNAMASILLLIGSTIVFVTMILLLLSFLLERCRSREVGGSSERMPLMNVRVQPNAPSTEEIK